MVTFHKADSQFMESSTFAYQGKRVSANTYKICDSAKKNCISLGTFPLKKNLWAHSHTYLTKQKHAGNVQSALVLPDISQLCVSVLVLFNLGLWTLSVSHTSHNSSHGKRFQSWSTGIWVFSPKQELSMKHKSHNRYLFNKFFKISLLWTPLGNFLIKVSSWEVQRLQLHPVKKQGKVRVG